MKTFKYTSTGNPGGEEGKREMVTRNILRD